MAGTRTGPFSSPTCLPCQWEQDFLFIQEFLRGWGEGADKCCRQRAFTVSLGTRRSVELSPTAGCSVVNCREPKRELRPVVGRIRTCAGKPQWISSPSPSPLGHNYLLQPSLPC